MSTIIDLPPPPSVNGLYRNTTAAEQAYWVARGHKKRSRVKTDRYRTWLSAAGWDIKAQHPAPVRGRYDLTVTVAEGASKSDLGNLIKATEDLLVAHHIIDDDRDSNRIILQWGPVPTGCRVEIAAAAQGRAAA